jgi:dipeptidyl aminopeptidase/acylaminoacyl peptidase
LEADWAFDRPVWSLDRRYLYATREKPDVPKQLCRIDLVTGEMMLIDDINERFRGIEIPPHIAIRQVNRYGDELTGYLFYPPGFRGQNRLPFAAIRGQVWDGFCDGGTGVEFPGMVMAMKGYAVLFFEPGSKHFGDSKDGNATYSLLRWQSPIENLRLLIASLDTKGWIDPKKTAIAGLSYGADLVDYAAGFSDVFSVGAATTGDVEAPTNYFIFGTDKDNDNFVKRFGLPYPDLAGLPAWQAVSASLNASRSNMPLLFQPPDSEAWMTISQHIAWQHVGLPVETYVYPDEGHIKVHPLNRYYVMLRNLQWFDFWLLGIEDSSPQFADQFKRWEKMRDEWMSTKSKHAAAPSASPSTR